MMDYRHDGLFDDYDYAAAKDSFRISDDQFAADQDADTHGTANPSLMGKPFWKSMVYKNVSAWQAKEIFKKPQESHDNFDSGRDLDDYSRDQDLSGDQDSPEAEDLLQGQNSPEDQGRTLVTDFYGHPVWCFNRFGATRTKLPDGRTVCIGGEHEDFYDPDFYIYNDVIVIAAPQQTEPPLPLTPDAIQIYGYPISIFPPTDFHTSTYIIDKITGKEHIIIIGGLGYPQAASREKTEVYQLDLSDFSIARLETSGKGPAGGKSEHTAELIDSPEGAVIVITTQEPQIPSEDLDEVSSKVSGETFALRVRDWTWIPWNEASKSAC